MRTRQTSVGDQGGQARLSAGRACQRSARPACRKTHGRAAHPGMRLCACSYPRLQRTPRDAPRLKCKSFPPVPTTTASEPRLQYDPLRALAKAHARRPPPNAPHTSSSGPLSVDIPSRCQCHRGDSRPRIDSGTCTPQVSLASDNLRMGQPRCHPKNSQAARASTPRRRRPLPFPTFHHQPLLSAPAHSDDHPRSPGKRTDLQVGVCRICYASKRTRWFQLLSHRLSLPLLFLCKLSEIAREFLLRAERAHSLFSGCRPAACLCRRDIAGGLLSTTGQN